MQRGVNASPAVDQYFKGALLINTIRTLVSDDAKWFAFLHDFFQHFKYQNIMTEDVVRYYNEKLGMELTAIFDEYLRHDDLPVLDCDSTRWAGRWHIAGRRTRPRSAYPFRWEPPITGRWSKPTAAWQILKMTIKKDEFQIPTDLYYVWVAR